MFHPKRSVRFDGAFSATEAVLQTSASLRQRVVGMEGVRQEETLMEIYRRLYIKDLILSGTFLRVSLNLNRCRRKTAEAGKLSVTVKKRKVEVGGGVGVVVQERTELCGQKGIIHHLMKSAVSD